MTATPMMFTIATVGVMVIVVPPGGQDVSGKFVDRGRKISFLAKVEIRLCAVAAALVGRFQTMDLDDAPTPTGRAEG